MANERRAGRPAPVGTFCRPSEKRSSRRTGLAGRRLSVCGAEQVGGLDSSLGVVVGRRERGKNKETWHRLKKGKIGKKSECVCGAGPGRHRLSSS